MNHPKAFHLKSCVPAKPGDKPLSGAELDLYKNKVDKNWQVIEEKVLYRKIGLHQFATPLSLAVAIGEMAEEQWHHPCLKVSWGSLEVEIHTHDVGGLLESDFIFAAKVDFIVKSKFADSSANNHEA